VSMLITPSLSYADISHLQHNTDVVIGLDNQPFYVSSLSVPSAVSLGDLSLMVQSWGVLNNTGNLRAVIYSSSSTYPYVPDALLYSSDSVDIATIPNGSQVATTTFSFNGEILDAGSYFIGLEHEDFTCIGFVDQCIYLGTDNSSTGDYGVKQVSGIWTVVSSSTSITFNLTSVLNPSESVILAIVPTESDNVASTSLPVFSVYYFISDDDVGDYLRYKFLCINAVVDFWADCSLSQIFRVEATSSGYHRYTWTGDNLLPVGSYSSFVDLQDFCVFGVCLGIEVDSLGYLVSSSTDWFVGEPSALGQEADNVFDAYDEALSSTGATTTAMSKLYCSQSWAYFDFTKCISALFVPSKADVQKSFDTFYGGTMSNLFPFGYVKRISQMFYATTTLSVLPDLVVTIPSELPMSGYSIDLSPWGLLMGTGSYLDTEAPSMTGGRNFRDVTEGGWNILVDIFFGLSLLAIAVKIKGL